MKIAGIMQDSVVDGIGLRDTIFFQGCNRKCEGCHNPSTWDLSYGKDMSVSEILSKIRNQRVTISGGEPMLQYKALLELCRELKEHGKSIWLYTGNTITLPLDERYLELSKYVDVIVDGHFILEQRDTTLPFRGSKNQRLIDLQKTVRTNAITHWNTSISPTALF